MQVDDLVALTDQQKTLIEQLRREKDEPIAIVGMGLRFPGENSTPDGLADFLRAGGSGIGPIPSERWHNEELFSDDPLMRGKIRSAGGGYLRDIYKFDPTFFNISPKEAPSLDPQQQLILETAWESLEHANIDPARLRHTDGGVYVAVSGTDQATRVSSLPYEELDMHTAMGSAHSVISGRLSYFLGLRGPSLSVDTACSSSLVALHLAVQGLRRRECEIALCGGVNAVDDPRPYIMASQADMLSADGRCKTFDDSADGYGRSEGCAMVVLKRLSDAQRDGDRVLALIRGSAVRQDGESAGLMAPNGVAQEALLRVALKDAGLGPQDIQYLEAHGTGTPLGDPIEMGAIAAVFGSSHTSEDPLIVGSLKTNLGHMEAAAGIGGVVKTVLQLREGAIYPHLNFENPSKRIPWDRYPVSVPRKLTLWPAEVRRAIVNSFGFAGTIAAVVLEQAPATVGRTPGEKDDGSPHVITVSAKSSQALEQQLTRYRQHVDTHPHDSVRDLCYTSNVGRSHFNARFAGVVRSRADLTDLLDRTLSREKKPGNKNQKARKIAFLFGGGGAQYVGMGRPLYERFPVFRKWVDECDRLFEQQLGYSIKAIIFGHSEEADKVHLIHYTQPALFTIEYALAQLWISWGVRPNVVMGHSLGEIVAATVAGLIDLDDATTLMAARGRLMHTTAPGSMVAVQATAADVLPLLKEYADVSLAAINGPEQSVISGGRRSVEKITASLDAKGLKTKTLPVSCASHSPLMAEVFNAFRTVLEGISFHDPEIALVSNLSGTVSGLADMGNADYWVRHLGGTVDFAGGMRAIEQRGEHIFVEIGPSTELIGMGRHCVSAENHLWLNSLHAADTDAAVIRTSLAQLYTAGIPISWAAYHDAWEGRTVDLPAYAFDRKDYRLPVEKQHLGPMRGSGVMGHPLLGTEISTDEQRRAGIREFSAKLSEDYPGYLQDHKVFDRVVFPGAGYVEIIFALQESVFGLTGLPISDLRIHEALFLEKAPATLRTRLHIHADGRATVDIVSRWEEARAASERCHATAVIEIDSDQESPLRELTLDLKAASEATGTPKAVWRAEDLYLDFADHGIDYGPAFQGIKRVIRLPDGTSVADLTGHDTPVGEHLPPALLDAALQTVATLVVSDATCVPVRFDRCRLLKKPMGSELVTVARLSSAVNADADFTADILVLEGKRPVFILEGLGIKRLETATPRSGQSLFHDVRWLKRSLPDTEREPRNVLVVGGPGAGSADFIREATAAGVELSFAETAEEIASALSGKPSDVCWFWRAGAAPINVSDLRHECQANYLALLDLLRLLNEAGFGHSQRLWLVTERAQWLPGDSAGDGSGLAAATLWGFGHVMWSEYPAYKVTLVDMPEGGGGYQSLVREWLDGNPDEFQVAYRTGHRYVRRITTVDAALSRNGSPVKLIVGEYGNFGRIIPVPLEDRKPEGDEIQVQVHASGLVFEDVFNALGLRRQHAREHGLEHEDVPLGSECAGTVIDAGPEADYQVGDEVVIRHRGCLSQRVTVSSKYALRKPVSVSFAEAAGLPTAYLTAYYALHHLCDIKAGDRVLIHSAGGGVEQAAVQLAKLAGAEVYAMASPGEWPQLRALGVQRVMDPQTPDFAEEIRRLTGGESVDIVLNSLSGDFIPSVFAYVAPGGRFVDLSKISACSGENDQAARTDVAYHVVDLDEIPEGGLPQVTTDILKEVFRLLDEGLLQPLVTTVYTLDEVEEAFSVVSRGANAGKPVIDLRPDTGMSNPPVNISSEKTYLVTGGFGALGIATAQKLVDHGARKLALVSRSAIPEDEVAELRDRLGPDVRLTAYQGDIGDPEDVRRIFDSLGRHPLGGIIHAAGILADTPIETQTWQNIDKVFQSKVYGTWLLHQASEMLPDLDFFIGYSSISSVVGHPGQSNYAAANAFVDGLMHWRHRRGLPGKSINWGAWGEIGLAANLNEQHIKAIERQGVKFFRPSVGLRALIKSSGWDVPQIMVGDIDWTTSAAARPLDNALYELVARRDEGAVADIDSELLLGLPENEQEEAVNFFIRSHIAQLLHFDGPESLPPDVRFFEVGMDSLTSVQLKNILEITFQIPLSTAIIFDHPAVDLLTAFVTQQIRQNREDPDEGQAPDSGTRPKSEVL
ncbi:type I polyketide synthase [Streptosporangium sp. NPDC002607]